MKNRKDNPNVGKKESHLFRKLLITLAIIVTVAGLSFGTYFFIHKLNENKITISTIKTAWNKYDYTEVYNQAKTFLQDNPYNNTALTYYAYACFYLAVSQNDNYQTQEYLDDCINNLRLALYDANKSLIPQLQYMLGKAYFYKNTISTYYYADLAVKYLNLAKDNGYEADDIAEYLGLSYASLGMTVESISSFTEALLVRESDSLLLSIAEQYTKLEEYQAAQQYLYRIINNSDNLDLILKSNILLADIYISTEQYEDALNLYNKILEDNPNSADAHYGLGVIYEKQDNAIKARAEWRKALKIQPNHSGALKKISDN